MECRLPLGLTPLSSGLIPSSALLKGKKACMIMDRCPIVDPVHRVQRKLSDFLKTVTLADIAEPSVTQAGK